MEQSEYLDIIPQRPVSMADMLKGREMPKFSKKEVFEFEALAKEIMDATGWKGNKIFPLFYNPKYNERKIRDAFTSYGRSKVKTFSYFMGILNKTK